jgi:mRNA interferase MazF
MQKDFDKWNEYKKAIDNNGRNIDFHERDVWWASIGVNVGSEQDSYTRDFARPVIILKKFTEWFFLGVPLTTKIKKNDNRICFTFNNIKNDMLLWHIRSFDSKRLINRMGVLSQVEYRLLVSSLVQILTKSTETPSEGVSKAEARVCTGIKYRKPANFVKLFW